MTQEVRYQVFVSSTFEDLQEERRQIIQALLELDCIPAGMELFPAADDDQWTLIKRVIDGCDYYVVIVAGRYGSTNADGKSYTQLEYEYAVARGVPVLAFLHKDPETLPAKRTEKTPEGRERLEAFRAIVKKKTCMMYDSPGDLGSAVMRSVIKATKSTPRVGWVRGDQVVSSDAAAEMLRLRARVDELEREAATSRSSAPPGTESLSQGEDKLLVRYSFSSSEPSPVYTRSWTTRTPVTWNALFGRIAPVMINEATDGQLREEIDAFLAEVGRERFKQDKDVGGKALTDFNVTDKDFHLIKVQLRALGLISVKEKTKRAIRDTATYWTLTPYGDSVMTRLNALTRKMTEGSAGASAEVKPAAARRAGRTSGA